MSKLNWIQVKTEYTTDPTSSYVKLAKKHQVAVSTIAVRAGRENWAADRIKTLSNVEEKTIEKTTEKQSETIAEINDQHNKIAKLLIHEALKALKEQDEDGLQIIKPKSFRDIREALTDGVAIQRKALSMDDRQAIALAQQINVTLPTWYTNTRDRIAENERLKDLEAAKLTVSQS